MRTAGERCERAARSANRLWIDPFVLLYLLAVYTNVAIWRGQQLLAPAPAPFLVCAAFFAVNPAAFSRKLLIAFAGLVGVLALTFVLTSLQLGEFRTSVLLTTVSFAYSLLVGLGGFAIVVATPRARLSRSLATFAAALMVGAALDGMGVLRPLSDAFRTATYPNWLQYGREGIGVLRDTATYGGYRPTVFAAEPSLVGIWGLVGMAGWLMLKPVRLWSRRTALYLAYAAAMLALVRTPTLILAGPILLIAWMAQGAGRPLGPAIAAWLRPLRFVAAAAGLTGLGAWAAGLPASGALAFIGGPSFYERVVAPQILAGRVVAEHPLLGIGLGDKKTLWALTQRLVVDSVPDAQGLLEGQDSAIALLCNSFYLHWIYFGLAGGTAMLLAYAAALKSLGLRDTAAVGAVAACLMFTLGGYTGVVVWAIVMIVAGVRRQYERSIATAPARYRQLRPRRMRRSDAAAWRAGLARPPAPPASP